MAINIKETKLVLQYNRHIKQQSRLVERINAIKKEAKENNIELVDLTDEEITELGAF